MSVRWSVVALAVVFACWASACGDDKPPLFDPGTFSGMHQDEILKDCKESLQCRAQMGMELPDSPMEQCVNDSAERLESSETIQESFLRKYGRCSNYVVCDYYTCATSNVSGYGDTQRDKVSHDCTATIECSRIQGTFTGDPQTALQGCVATRTGALDNFTLSQRQTYEATFRTCQPLTACQFTGCFNGGAGTGMAATMPTMP
jgi:hypothetical protein